MSITNWGIRHSVSVLVLIVVLIVTGLASYVSLPREAAPDITIPVVLVSTPYVGVAPADIEQLITRPLEDELTKLKDVRKMTSTSADGVSIVSIEFEPDVDIDNALQKVREKVDVARPELPGDITDEPSVQEISFSEFPIMVINISGEMGISQLEQHAEAVQDRLEKIEGILDVNLVGGLEREISIEADPGLMEYYGVSLGELSGAIQAKNLNMPGGEVDVGDMRYSVRVPGEFERVPEIADVVIREADGQAIRVRDVAKVYDGFEDQKTYSRVEGMNSVSLSLTRRAGENILRITEEAKLILEDERAITQGRITYTIVGDVSKNINDRVSELENNILTGLILVSAVLLFFMGGFRNAFFVAVAIPMSMLISFIVLAALEITLNIVVLFSLVLALGMLVDNAIVIVENIYRHGNMGKTRAQAAMDGTAEVAWPVIASTATTVFAFFPMMFWPGIMGEFMAYLPMTVIIVLLSSLFVALVINPVLCALFMRFKTAPVAPEGAAADSGDVAQDSEVAEEPETPVDEVAALPDNVIYRIYGATLRFCLRRRWVVALAVVAGFVGTFAAYGANNHGVEFFPETTPERFYVNVTLPDGSNLEASDRIMRAVERRLMDRDNIKAFVADVGAGNGNQMDFGSGGTSPHRSRITVELVDVTEQVEHPDKTIDDIRADLAGIVGAEIEVVKESGGPPTGAPINIELVGDDYTVLGEMAAEVEALVASVDNVVNVKNNHESGRPEITVRIDEDAAAGVQLSVQDVANTVRMGINGMTASVFREGSEEFDIIVRLEDGSRSSVEAIESLRVKNRMGAMIPLTEVAAVRVESGYGSIRHIDGDRVVTVSAETTTSMNADQALKDTKALIGEAFEVPPGYELNYTGQNEEQAEAQTFLGQALMAGLFLIALVLVTQFNSVAQPFIILCSVVLSLLGVLWTLMIRELPFGVIMTGIGIISLAGVVVNNSIVLIDYTNQLKARGMSSYDAVYTAGMVRFRPVLLTAFTTILSLLPVVLGYSVDFFEWRVIAGGSSVEMWGNMSNAVAGGLLVATFLTLIVVPVMYSAIDSGRNQFSRIGGAIARFKGRRKERAAERDLEGDTGTAADGGGETGGAAPAGAVTALVLLAAALGAGLAPSPAFAQDAPPPTETDAGETSAPEDVSEDTAGDTAGRSRPAKMAAPVRPATTRAVVVEGDSGPVVALDEDAQALDRELEAAALREEALRDRVLTLDEARVLLQETATNLAITEQAVASAETLEDSAYTVFYPQVVFNATYTLNDDEVAFSQPNAFAPFGPYLDSVFANDPQLQQFFADNPDAIDARALAAAPGTDVVVQNRHDYRFTLTVTQPIFNYRAWPLLDVAEIAVEQATLARSQATYELERALHQLYFNAVSFQRLIDVAERNVELAQVNYQRAVDLEELEMGLKFEVNRTELDVSSAKRNLENARLGYSLAVESLATLLEAEPDFDVEPPPELSVPEEDDLDTLTESAVERRSSLEAIQLDSELKEAQEAEVDARWWPTVEAQGQAWVQRGTAFGGDDFRWALSLSATWVIYDGGLNGVEADQIAVERVQNDLEYQLERIEVESEVRQAWLQARSEEQNVSTARAEAELAATNEALTMEARELEAASAVDVELAQQQRFVAEVAVVRAEVLLQQRIYELYRVAGAWTEGL